MPVFSLNSTLQQIHELVDNGGPTPAQYPEVLRVLTDLNTHRQTDQLTTTDYQHMVHAFGHVLSTQTMQGFVFQRPHGYPGDFEVLERIYTYYVADHPRLRNWDYFMHAQSATKAVRNRVSYFREQLSTVQRTFSQHTTVLNLASGPGRDLYDALQILDPSSFHVDCVEQDRHAIQYAQSLCRPFLPHLRFYHQNVLRFRPPQRYHFIWSAGLFDYFSDALFIRVLKRFVACLEPQGRLVIGNFSDRNPSRGYMELFNWNLYHRSHTHLRSLAQACGVSAKNMWVEEEAEGVNLFLHIRHA